MKNKKIICIPVAYKPNMQSGENVFSSGDKRLLIYMKNASVALVSAEGKLPLEKKVWKICRFQHWTLLDYIGYTSITFLNKIKNTKKF